MFLSWWRSLVRMADPKTRKGTKPLRIPPKFRAALRVEQMEDRLVPTGGTANVFLNLQNIGGALHSLAAPRSATVPVYIDFNSVSAGTSGGVGGGTFYVAYDPNVLSISETSTSIGSDIKLGSLLAGLSADYTLAPAAGFSTGVVAIGLSHQNATFVTGAPSGHLIELDFHVAQAAALNSSTLLDLQAFYQDNGGNLHQSIIHDSGSAAYGLVPLPPSTYGALTVPSPPLTQPGALTPSTFTPADTDAADAAIQIVAQPPNLAPTAKNDTFSMAPNNANFSPTMTVLGLGQGVLANDTPTTNGPMSAVLTGSGVSTIPVAPATVTINSVSATGFTVTVTTAATNNYQVGEEISISGVALAAYNGTFLVSSVLSPTQFTYQSATANLGPSTSGQVQNGPQTLYRESTPNGSVTLNSGDGSIAYTPAPDFSGTDSFTYEAVDTVSNTPSVPAQVTIYVGGYLFIPQNLNAGGLGSQVVVPVNILNPNPINSGGLDDATIAINYASGVFSVAAVSIGSINGAAGWTAFTANTNNAGQIIITTGATNGALPVSSTAGGSLALITFNVINLPPGNTSVVNLAGASPQITALDVAGTGVPVPLPFAVPPQDNVNFSGPPGPTDGLVNLTPGVGTSTVVSAAVDGTSVATVTYGTRVTLTATISPASGSNVPGAGSVDFKDGSIDLGLVSTETVSGNSAIFTLISTPNQLQVTGGVHTITASYAPGAGFSGSTGTLAGGLGVTPAALTITAIANAKTYDSTTSAAAAPTVSGLVAGDSVTGLAEVYSDQNAGSSKVLSVNAFTIIDGNSGNNYTVTKTTNTTGIITPASLTIKALTNTKLFDSTVTAAAIPTVSGLLGGDSITGLAEVYGTPDVGTGKTLSVSSYTVVDGNSGNNYTITKLNDTTGAIFTPGFSKFLVTILSSTPVVAGQNFLFEVQAADGNDNPITDYTGPSSVTVTTSPTDLFGNSFPVNVPILSAGIGFFQGNLEKAGSYTLLASAGGFSGQSSSFAVVPSFADHFVVTAPPSALSGVPINVTASVFDHFGNPITNYSGAVQLTSSDGAAQLGNPYTFTTSGANPDNGTHTFSVLLSTPGSQTVSVSDTISTNPTVTGTTQPIVTRGLVVTNFTKTPTGFTATFNRQIMPADLSLYGANLTTVQDVTMRGAVVGPIHGTLVIDPSNLSMTFNATSSYLQFLNRTYDGAVSAVLPDDTYTITLASGTGANGLIDQNGDHLDGANTGGHANYVTTFSTNFQQQAIPALGIPDFARGPDNSTPIKVPNNTSLGIPITLYQAANVTDAAFTLSYNSALLNITSVLQGANSDATDPNSSLTLVSALTPGLATFHYHDATPQSGALVLGDIVAVVPNTAVNLYKTKALLQIGNVVLNQGSITGAVGATSVQINSYFGDLDGDGLVMGNDKLIANQVAVGLATGFDAYKLADPVITGDVANDLSVDAGDVVALNLFEMHLNPAQIPTPPTQLATTDPNYINPSTLVSPNAADPTLNLANQPNSSPSSFVVSVNIDHPHPKGSAGMTEASLALTYDPSVLSVTAADISLGSIPSQSAGWQLESVVDATTGQIGIEIYSLTPITASQAGSLVNIAFHPQAGERPAATSSVQLVNAVTPDGISFATIVADSQGGLILSPGQNQVVIQTGAAGLLEAPSSAGSALPMETVAKNVDLDHVFANVKDAAAEIAGDSQPPTAVSDNLPMAELGTGAAAVEMPTARGVASGPIVTGSTVMQGELAPAAPTQLVNQSILISPVFLAVALTPGSGPPQLVDRLFLSLSLSANAQAATDWSGQLSSSSLWDNSAAADWLARAPFAAPEVPAANAPAGGDRRSEAPNDRIPLLEKIFADFGNEADDGSDFGDL